jgi:DNA replication protein DnaC
MSAHAQLAIQIRNLKLSGMLEHLDLRLMEAEQHDLAYTEFLSMILTDELETRTARKISRLMHTAGLGTEKTLETFDFAFNPTINQKLIRSLATCRFIERGEGLFLLGPTGTGKTHLAKALAHQACRRQFTVGFYSFHQLFAEMATADLQNRLSRLMTRLHRLDLLVLDDFGFKAIDQHSAERFYALVDGRFGQRSVILTSNRAMTDWSGLFPDPIIGNAILDRLAHTSHQLVIKGQSYRKKLAPKAEEG